MRMPDKTFKIVELVGVSNESVQQAVRNAIKRAGETLKGMSWFEVTDIRGTVSGDEVSAFQVTVKVGFLILHHDEIRGA
jgi:flavin-binding protein dodecin